MIAWLAVALAAAIAVWVALSFNRLVRARNRVREAWAQIDVQLRLRADLVPQLVEAVSGYRDHERSTLERVVTARRQVVEARGPQASGEADDQLEVALGQLYAVAEAYPDLRADTVFRDLQVRLTAVEDDVASARRYYNALVERYRSLRQTFPTVLLAGPLGFGALEFFKADGGARAVPGVGLAEGARE